MRQQEKIKVVIAKLGLDIHWRGAVSVARLLRDAGMEVVYLGNQFPEAIVASALQEGADVVGLSTLAGNHLTLGPKVARLLKEKGLNDVMVVIGGTIPARDFAPLKEQGMDEVFGPNTPMEEIIQRITEGVRRKRNRAATSA